jgi:hypothetical protein
MSMDDVFYTRFSLDKYAKTEKKSPNNVNLDLALYQEQHPFSSFRKNSKKVRAVCVLLCNYLINQNWDGIKLILVYSYTHSMVIDAVCGLMDESFANVLGEWVIDTFRNKREMRPLYTSLVNQKRELFYLLKNLSIGYMIKTRDLVNLICTDSHPESVRFSSMLILRFGLKDPCIQKYILSGAFVTSCINNGNYKLLGFLRDLGFNYGNIVDESFVAKIINRMITWKLFGEDRMSFVWELHSAKIKIADPILDETKQFLKTKFYMFSLVRVPSFIDDKKYPIPDDILYHIASYI